MPWLCLSYVLSCTFQQTIVCSQNVFAFFYHTTMEPFYKTSTVGLNIIQQNKIDTTPKSRPFTHWTHDPGTHDYDYDMIPRGRKKMHNGIRICTSEHQRGFTSTEFEHLLFEIVNIWTSEGIRDCDNLVFWLMSSLPSDSRYPCRSRHMERGKRWEFVCLS